MSTFVRRAASGAARRWRWIAALVAALALYAALGFLAAPYALKRAVPRRLEEALGRKVAVERIRVNPFTLSLTVDGFVVFDVDGRTPALSWRSLFVDYELWAIVKHEQRFAAIRLVEPAVRGGLRRDGSPSFADVAERLRKQDAGEGEKAGKRWTIVVDQLDIEGASIEFHDASRAAPFEHRIGPLTLHVESFRTTADGRSPYQFSGRTEAGERFSWTGTLRVAPIRSSGTLVVEDVDLPRYAPYYSDVLLAQVRKGRAMLRATYELDLGRDRVVKLLDGELRVRGVALQDREGGAPILSLPELDVSGIRVDVSGNTARVERVEARGGVLSVRRDQAGALNLSRVVSRAAPAGAAAGSSGTAPNAASAPLPAAPAKAPAAAPLKYEVGAVALHGWRVEMEDRVPPRPVGLALGDVEVTLRDLRSAPDAESPLAVSLTWPGGGKLRIDGSVAPARPAAKLTISAEAISLVPVEPYVALYGRVRARLADGKLRGGLRTTLDLAKAEAPSYAVAGDAAIDSLVLLDDDSQEVVRWRSLEANGIDVRSSPAGTQLDVLRLLDPQLRVVRLPDHTTNLARLSAPAGSAGSAEAPAEPRGKAAKGPAPEPTPFRIGTIAVERGLVTVTDRSMKPPAVLHYKRLRARLTGFSNDARARTGIDVEALVEGSAPLRIAGTLNPRLVGDVTNVTVRSKGIDLTPFGPYSSRYMGYALERGKLDLDMRYRVKQRNLKAENVVRIDQLALGEKTDSPDAPSFPMSIALAVLTDRHGVMLLDVPVEGNLDDPEFRLGRVVWHAIVNVLGKIATAPFTAIASLVGGGGDAKLDVIDFAPGSARLESAAVAKLDQLAKALQERPGLKLEVEGVVDGAADGAALGRDAVRALAAREKWQRSKPKGGAAMPTDLAVTDEEYPRYLKLAYDSALQAQPPPAAPAGAQRKGPPTPEEMEALLLERVDVGAALRNLSSERAAAVREQLLAREIDQARLFLSESAGKDAGGPSARLKLK